MDLELTGVEIHQILKKIGNDVEISPLIKIVIENDTKLKKTIMRG